MKRTISSSIAMAAVAFAMVFSASPASAGRFPKTPGTTESACIVHHSSIELACSDIKAVPPANIHTFEIRNLILTNRRIIVS